MNIFECQTVRDVLKYCSYNTLVIFDLDNTLFRPTRAEEVASEQFCTKIFEQAFVVSSDRTEALSLAITVCNAARKNVTIKLVEPNAAIIIKRLQDIGIPVLALTARGGEEDIEVTEKQLNSVSVDFSKQWKNLSSFKIKKDERFRSSYQNGVIYCDGAGKGICLSDFIKQINYKPAIVMIDDKKENLVNLCEHMNHHDIDFIGLRYGFLDSRVSMFDMVRSQNHLLRLQSFFSPSEKRAIEKLQISLENSQDLITRNTI